MALTIASLVCLVLIGLGGTNRHISSYNNMYFFRANTTDIDIDPSTININLPDNDLTDKVVDVATEGVKKALNVKDFYHIHLWNYCDGDFTDDHSSKAASDKVTHCSDRKNQFWFNPVEVWHLNNTKVDQLFSKELRAGLSTYKTVTKWMFICYVAAVIATIVEILVGFLALFSRIGSVITTIVSVVSSLFIVGFALTATILYSTLAATFNSALNKYNIRGSLGRNIYVTTWLGVAFSCAAGLFWLLSACCCSGRSDRIKGYDEPSSSSSANKKGKGAGLVGGFFGKKKANYQYERMGSPFEGGLGYNQQQRGHQMGDLGGHGGQRGTAYEPFRHDRGGMA